MLAALALGGTATASASAAAAPEAGFLRHPTDQLGVPGAVEAAELTPTGSLYTGRLELTLRVGQRLRAWDQPTRTLEGDLPVYRALRRVDGLVHRVRAFAVDAAGVPVVHLRVEVRNGSRRPRPLRLGLDVGWVGPGVREARPAPDQPLQPRYRFLRGVVPVIAGGLEQPGDGFDRGWRYRWQDGVLDRSGSPLLAVGRLSGRRAAGDAVSRRTAVALRRDATGARQRLRATVAPGETRTLDVVVPLRPVPAGSAVLQDSFDAGLARLAAAWRPVLDRAMRLETPEPAVDRAWRAGLQALLVPRHQLPDGRWIQGVNKFQYQASWLRDTAMIAHTLDLVGLHDVAGQDVAFMPSWQNADGLLQSRLGQQDGMGQALWSFGDHALRSRDAAQARELLPVVDRAIGWVERRLAEDPRWILPPSDPRDNEELAGHATGDLAWLAGGVRRVVGVAQVAGDARRAAAWSTLADRVAAVARARVAEAAVDGVVPPVLDATGGERWGQMWLAWPTELLPPDDPLVRATMAAGARDEREGLAIWDKRLHLYLGLRRRHTALRDGRPDVAVAGVYSVLAHLTSSSGTWEQASKPYGRREVLWALGPHGWAAADLMSLLHDMLVREQGSEVLLLDALPPAWLRPGARTRIRRAATIHGPVDLELDAAADGAVLRWSADVPEGTPLRLRIPAAVERVQAPGLEPDGRSLLLPARSGELRLSWRPRRVVRRGPDAASVRQALRRAYARRGKPW
ncbi:hypothetical protein [Patulibacter defluvii]|uniref:hypothetical protein n=1 Tax=Patulibacter defluvii TaxID=3095358 RepID=UPI002A74B6B7|nr:hypothetical protein [Patulibacter sp. DM4]